MQIHRVHKGVRNSVCVAQTTRIYSTLTMHYISAFHVRMTKWVSDSLRERGAITYAHSLAQGH